MTVDNPQHVSAKGLVAKVQREALVTIPYMDGVWRYGPRKGEIKVSIGVGSQTPEVQLFDPPISIPQAIERLRADVALREIDINRKLDFVIPQGAFDALVSIYYQKGSAALNEISDLMNAGELDWAIALFKQDRFCCGEDGVVTKGHTKRRVREMIMAWDNNYGDQSMYPFFNSNPRETKPQMRPVSELGLL